MELQERCWKQIANLKHRRAARKRARSANDCAKQEGLWINLEKAS
jgi:hypothetical protein